MVFQAKVYVTLKRGVLDPQGKAVRGGLRALGYEGIADVRIGKFIELTVEAAGEGEALALVQQMAERLLANPVIEDFRCEVLGATCGDKGVTPCASA